MTRKEQLLIEKRLNKTSYNMSKKQLETSIQILNNYNSMTWIERIIFKFILKIRSIYKSILN